MFATTYLAWGLFRVHFLLIADTNITKSMFN